VKACTFKIGEDKMKRLYFIISIFISFITVVNVNTQNIVEWEVLNEGGNFGHIEFVNDQVGWLANEGKLLKTEDGGETWISIPLETDGWVDQIDFINEQIGWYSTSYYDAEEKLSYSTISKSYDGGITWTIQLNRVGGSSKLIAMNDSVVYVAGHSYILKTSDGGMSWMDQTANLHDFYVSSVWPFNITNLLVLLHKGNSAYSILNTLDGGDTWEVKEVPEFEHIFNIQFINDSTGYFLAITHEEERTSLCKTFYKTSDTFNTWTLLFDTDSLSFESYHAFNNSIIWGAVRNTNGYIDLSENIIKSTDGGITWEKKQTMWWHISNVFFTETGVGFIFESLDRFEGGNLYKSTDQGNTWKMKKMGQPLTDIYFINENDGFAGSGYVSYGWAHTEPFGNLLITNDGGKSWRQSFTFPNDNIFSCVFVNDKVGFVLSQNPLWRGYIYKTVDSGYNWSPVYEENFDSTGYDFTGNEIGFKSEEVGWAIGSGNWGDDSSGAAILGTYNSGENWDLVWKYPDTEVFEYALNSIHAVNKTAWAIGENGMIVKYTEQDQWQVIPSVTDLPLNDVFFSDEEHGWIAGGYLYEGEEHLILLKTTNSGDTWEEIPYFNYQINDMYFADSLHGWAIGNDTSGLGMILETLNGGDSWALQVEGLSNPLTALYFKDGVGWVVGGNGLVLRTDNWTTWINPNTREVYPAKFSLSQNYPNPFNPTTIINYELAKTSDVQLAIYDLLGQKLATLVSKRQPAGSHKVEWDASSFSSGVYFYRVETNNGFVQSRKLILLK